MQNIALIGGTSISTAASIATLAASQEQCNNAWTKADKDVDGDLSGSELMRYLFATSRSLDSARGGPIALCTLSAANLRRS